MSADSTAYAMPLLSPASAALFYDSDSHFPRRREERATRMKRRIEKAVVLGAGTMGSRIAAHLANAGVPCVLLDMVPPDLPAGAPAGERNPVPRARLCAPREERPAALFLALRGG